MFKVLLVDDEAWILAGLQAMIDWKREGFEICATASNGIEALEFIEKNKPDLILADIRMPGCDGITMLENLRRMRSESLFAIVSGYAEFEYAQKCLQYGAQGYLLKPVEEDELIQLLRNIRKRLLKQYETRIVDELDHDTGLLAHLFPHGCTLTVVYGDALLASATYLSCRISQYSNLYVTDEPMFKVDADVPTTCSVGTTTLLPNQYNEFSDLVALCHEASWQSFIQPDRRLFTLDEILDKQLLLPENVQVTVDYMRSSLCNCTVTDLYRFYLLCEKSLDSLALQTPEWMLSHFQNAEVFLDAMCQKP